MESFTTRNLISSEIIAFRAANSYVRYLPIYYFFCLVLYGYQFGLEHGCIFSYTQENCFRPKIAVPAP